MWRVLVGSKNDSIDHTGIGLVYTTKDFISYNLLPGVLDAVDKVGMWECTDLFPVASAGPLTGQGLDNNVPPGKDVKHVLKAGLNDEWHDYYAIGTYDREANKFTPDDETINVGIGLRYDWGKFYASRTFYDPVKQRRVLWGYVGETTTEDVDIKRGWASVEVILDFNNERSRRFGYEKFHISINKCFVNNLVDALGPWEIDFLFFFHLF